jgi:hypothetical protein
MKDEIIKIPVYMVNEDAKRFLEFQEHYDFFSLLIDKKVHQQKGASITLNIDNKGRIGSITRNDVLYLSTVSFDNVNPKSV